MRLSTVRKENNKEKKRMMAKNIKNPESSVSTDVRERHDKEVKK